MSSFWFSSVIFPVNDDELAKDDESCADDGAVKEVDEIGDEILVGNVLENVKEEGDDDNFPVELELPVELPAPPLLHGSHAVHGSMPVEFTDVPTENWPEFSLADGVGSGRNRPGSMPCGSLVPCNSRQGAGVPFNTSGGRTSALRVTYKDPSGFNRLSCRSTTRSLI